MSFIAVRAYFNTDENNEPVPDDVPLEEMPTVYYGPFQNMDAAVEWMHNGYPDDDTDLHEIVADIFDIPEEWLNDPDKIFSTLDPADYLPSVPD